MLPLPTRQNAVAFDQLLSFDTSKVTDMSYMFSVRPPPRCALPQLSSRALPCTLALRRHRPVRPSRLSPRVSPSMEPRC